MLRPPVCEDLRAEVAHFIRRIEHDLEHGDAVGVGKIALGLGKRHEQDAGIIFRHADLEDGDHWIAFHPRRRAERGRGAARRKQRHIIADLDVEVVREPRAERDAILVVEAIEGAEADIAGDRLQLLEVGLAQAPNESAGRGRRGRHHHLALDQGQRIFDAGHGADLAGDVIVVGEVRIEAVHHDVAVQTEHLVEQLLPEAVHHRHDDDQRGDAEGDAEEREAGDHRDEALFAAGP